jgi:RimJ/RimL family protein N-acetyltransferase
MCPDEVDVVTLRTARLTLEPVSPAHAQEMATLLGDARLYAFTGGMPPTVSEDPPPPAPLTAVLAWALGARFHGRGYARDAAAEMMRWLARTGVTRFAAYIHPEHTASMGVARALGMAPTDELVDGEVVWARRADAGSAADLRGSE